MKRLLTLVGAASLVLAACGDDDDNASDAVATAGTAAGSATVTVVQVEGLGSVLADANGMVLYANDEEAADASVLCDKSCADEWPPLTTGSGTPSAEGVTGLGVADRPDGTSQVTYNGRRLYTFVEDAPGKATGDGESDAFDGQQFSWHAVTVDMAGAGGGATTTPSATQPSATTASTGY
jgi:predicted lipoprotein with Yx(FWY)xxD motif